MLSYIKNPKTILGLVYSNSVSDYKKALSLYLEGILNIGNIDFDFCTYYNDVKEIVSKIDKNAISDETKFKLNEYYKLY